MALIVPAILASVGCRTVSVDNEAVSAGASVCQTYPLKYLTCDQGAAFLNLLGLECTTRTLEEGNEALVVEGMSDQLRRAQTILDIVDSREAYCLETLGPASIVRKLPSNSQIAAVLGTADIGTFDEPPDRDARSRAIIDLQGDSVVAILPVRCRDRLRVLLANDAAAIRTGEAARRSRRPGERFPDKPTPVGDLPARRPAEVTAEMDGTARPSGVSVPSEDAATQAPAVITLTDVATSADPPAEDGGTDPTKEQGGDSALPKTVTISLGAARTGPLGADAATEKIVPANGDDVLTMTLPETITVIQLLDLVGRHVGLNYVYDPREIPNQPISLKLQGELHGEMRIKDLYSLLETVLDFMNLAMIRRQDNLVAVVPMEKALQTQPELVDGGSDAVQVGDTVVTRVFNIQYVAPASVMALLQNMKLTVAATTLEGSNRLLVTCHAGRMNRIEQLVEMIDRPGRPSECRFRRLSYVRATPLIARIRSLGGELEDVAVAAPVSTPRRASSPAVARPPAGKALEAADDRAVYLDADERTNRILMVGSPDDLTLVEKLVDVLDVAQEDPRSPHIYTIRHVGAQQALDKLQKLEVLKVSSGGTASPGANAAGDALTGAPLVAVLETTNQLLVKAAPDQHAHIRELLTYIDVTPTDTRTIAAYKIQYIDLYTAQETIEELELVSVDSQTSSFIPGPNQPVFPARTAVPITPPAGNPLQKVPVVVSESTRTLLVKATPEQQARIARIIQFIDRYTPEEEWTYQVYPLESSSPDHLAGLLERLIQQTTRDKDDKIERIKPKTSEQITIVPDPNTFSLIVYASQRSQKWIEGLITRLDKRRPQVLIDVTLVEITRTDSFEYDLNLVAGVNNPVIDNLVVDPIQRADRGSRLEGGFNLLDQDGNPTGRTRAFYSDKNVQALLTAMQRKNYGRVLAKPKVLVDDGRKGQIVTTDTTTYVKESIQIPQVGTPITTREFVPIDASIQLEITPHISEGNLLRLDVFLSRDDFGTRPLSGAPPDKATSEVTTTVFVPDDRTVILGGLVKLNQSKGGSKVPFLGDIPLVGVVFRSIDNSDIEKKLYVFLKANIVRPDDGSGLPDLQDISAEHREAFERSESEFQEHENIPGITPAPMPPEGVLRDYK